MTDTDRMEGWFTECLTKWRDHMLSGVSIHGLKVGELNPAVLADVLDRAIALIAQQRQEIEGLIVVVNNRDRRCDVLLRQIKALKRERDEAREVAEMHHQNVQRMDKLDSKAAQRIAALRARCDRLQKATVGAIPETTEYANGWNDCRKAYRAALQGEQDE